ncbi:MAG: ornithine cyclodeaminase family protein [Rhizobiaceae bacterium]
MKLLDADDVRRLLPMAEAIDCMEETMIKVSRGEANLPLRTIMDIDGTNKLGIMPGAMKSDAGSTLYGIKLLSLFPGNPAKGLSSHIGIVILFDPETGAPEIAMNADAITAIRTAAASAAATRRLANPDATMLAIIGTGEQAESHIEALTLVRNFTEIRIAGRTQEKAEAFVSRVSAQYPGVIFVASPEIKTAVEGADVVCSVTSTVEPVLFGDWIGHGTHVNAVGASIPVLQEIDETLLLRSELFVDYRASALAQAKEIITAIRDGRITEDHIRAEIGEVHCGSASGRSSADAITLYRSLGVAAQDLAAADLIRKRYSATE